MSITDDSSLLKRRASHLKSYYKNKDKYSEYNKDNKDKRAKQIKQWAIDNRVKRSESTKKHNNKVRKALIELLGGVCCKCGFSDTRALQVDHIKGGGSRESKSLTGMKNVFLLRKVLNGSKEYQLLCANCNWIKRVENNELSQSKDKLHD